MDEAVTSIRPPSPDEKSPDIDNSQLTKSIDNESGDESMSNGVTEGTKSSGTSKSPQINGKDKASGGKRQRKQVQRLSEAWNRVHEEKEVEKAKAYKEISASLEGATGTALGEIPLIESTLRKVKPNDLKVLHMIIYNRPGVLTEIRSNLRKFKGFSFDQASDQYEKKLTFIKSRSIGDLRGSLRVLNLEVSGTREQLATRLMYFLHKPTCSSVKYKGKVVKKSGVQRNSKGQDITPKSKVKPKRKSASKATSSDQSIEGTNDDDDDEQSEPEDFSEADDENDEESNVSSNTDSRKKSRKRPKLENAKSNNQPKKKPSLSNTSKNGTESKQNQLTTDSDEDVPLSSLGKAQAIPSNSQLKKNILDILKTVNLEVTSLKVVREKVFACYPNVDLTDRKEFINDTVKKLLSFA